MGLLNQTESEYYSGSDFGGYQFVSLQNVIDQFMAVYVGEDKLISKAKKLDIAFHAQRALAELSFDTFKSIKSYEITVPATLKMPLPQDYVNYVKLTWSDEAGIEHVIYPTDKSSNPTRFTDGTASEAGDSTTMVNFKAQTPAENANFDYDYDDQVDNLSEGQRYGIEPALAQTNGSFFISDRDGHIHFSSNLVGDTVVLKFISDSLGTDSEMKVHKFAEEAMYKQIAYAVLSTRANTPEYVVQRYKKDARASKRQAKLRLSNIKLEEITQTLRGKSKHIKH